MSVVTLEEAKTFFRLSPRIGALADAHVQQCLDLSERWIARETSSSFEYGIQKESFPGNLLYIAPHFGPVSQIISIYDSTKGRVLEEDEYEFVEDGDRIYAKTYCGNRVRWPNGYDRYTVMYYGGYTGDDGDRPFPGGLKLPILVLARHLYIEGTVLGMLTEEFYDMIRDFKLRGV